MSVQCYVFVQLKAVYMNINHDCLVKKEPVIKG